jgi:acyl carrier protein
MVSEKLKGAILKALDLESFEIDDTTTAGMVPGWDSLNHARVIAAVEDEFGVRFRTVELISLRNVGDLQTLVDRRTIA